MWVLRLRGVLGTDAGKGSSCLDWGVALAIPRVLSWGHLLDLPPLEGVATPPRGPDSWSKGRWGQGASGRKQEAARVCATVQ